MQFTCTSEIDICVVKTFSIVVLRLCEQIQLLAALTAHVRSFSSKTVFVLSDDKQQTASVSLMYYLCTFVGNMYSVSACVNYFNNKIMALQHSFGTR